MESRDFQSSRFFKAWDYLDIFVAFYIFYKFYTELEKCKKKFIP